MPRVDTRLPAPSQVTTRTRIGVTPESSGFTGCQVRVCFTACQVGTRRTPERPFSMRRGPCSRRTATSASASKRSPARRGSRARRSTCTSRRRPSCSARSTNAVNAEDVAPAFEKVWAADTAAAALDAWVDAVAEAVPKFIGIANTLDAARRSDPDVQATWDAPAESQYRELRAIGPTPEAREAADPTPERRRRGRHLVVPDVDRGLREPGRRSPRGPSRAGSRGRSGRSARCSSPTPRADRAHRSTGRGSVSRSVASMPYPDSAPRRSACRRQDACDMDVRRAASRRM